MIPLGFVTYLIANLCFPVNKLASDKAILPLTHRPYSAAKIKERIRWLMKENSPTHSCLYLVMRSPISDFDFNN